MSSEETAPDSSAPANQDVDDRELEEEISATLSNIQLSRQEIDINEEDFSPEEAERLEEVMEGCDQEYNNLFATLDQLGSCLDEVENRNDTLNLRVDELLGIMEKTQVERETSLNNWKNEADKIKADLNKAVASEEKEKTQSSD